MDLRERYLHAGLSRDAEAEGATREGRAAIGEEEEYEAVALSYHDTVLSGNLRMSVRQETSREGGGCLLPDDQFTKPGDRLLRFSSRST